MSFVVRLRLRACAHDQLTVDLFGVTLDPLAIDLHISAAWVWGTLWGPDFRSGDFPVEEVHDEFLVQVLP